jgi:hypothetical protein
MIAHSKLSYIIALEGINMLLSCVSKVFPVQSHVSII